MTKEACRWCEESEPLICEECGGNRESHILRFCDKCLEKHRKERGATKSTTWLDLARRLVPDAAEEELNDILWEHTCFPVGSVLQVARQLKTYAKERKY